MRAALELARWVARQLADVGLGLDLSPYYRRSQVIDLASSGLRHRVLAEVMGLMGRRG